MTTASYEAIVQVTDEAALRAFAMSLNDSLEEDMTIEEAIDEALINPRVAPLESGYEILKQVVFHDHGNQYRLRLDAMVSDPEALAEAARQSHRLAYAGEELEATNLGHALYEHVLGSNGSPPDAEVGFQVMNAWYEGPDVAPASSPSP
jgi:hypothetical protein